MNYLIGTMEKRFLKIQAERLFAAVEIIEKTLERDLVGAEFDLTKPQLRSLMSISRAKCCTMSELGKLTGYPSSALTGIIDRMIKKKLVRRVRDESDRRIVKVMATEVGARLAAEFHGKLMRGMSVVLEKIEPDEREKMVALLEKIASGFPNRSKS